MKREMNEKNLRMTGKAWEIRHTLRMIAKSGPSSATLSEYLKKQTACIR
ncbi:Z-ring formation inhibitor MciZ [Paenibacillaceae bacterium]|nr:Z-ring formation inhibitor MciZ [Paenibacillaceae bacterium]